MKYAYIHTVDDGHVVERRFLGGLFRSDAKEIKFDGDRLVVPIENVYGAMRRQGIVEVGFCDDAPVKELLS